VQNRNDAGADHLSGSPWRPSAGIQVLRQRAAIAQTIRQYFAESAAMEVSTPLLSPWATTDPALNSFVVRALAEPGAATSGFLQTSPEFAMKRLLAAGSGDISQFAHAFRAEESGRHHLPEFTLLEWYRVAFDHHRLMDDVEALVTRVLPDMAFERHSYASLFRAQFDLDAHTAATADLAAAAQRRGIVPDGRDDDRQLLQDALFADLCAAQGARRRGVFIYDFPCAQAAYARITNTAPALAQRFELIIDGIEIANGYHEVTDGDEQAARFARENERRLSLGLPLVEPDPRLLAALANGLPECAGVALGFDRLLMLCTQASAVAEVVSFVD
jgi:lysyl-tRNA synthetase class 2